MLMYMYMYMYILDTHPDDKAPVLSLPQCVCAGGRVPVLDRPPGITVCEPPPNVHTVYRQRGFAPHAEPSFRLGRFYFPRSRALSLPRPAGFENSKRQSDCLKLSLPLASVHV